jgi:hypothetical protein
VEVGAGLDAEGPLVGIEESEERVTVGAEGAPPGVAAIVAEAEVPGFEEGRESAGVLRGSGGEELALGDGNSGGVISG